MPSSLLPTNHLLGVSGASPGSGSRLGAHLWSALGPGDVSRGPVDCCVCAVSGIWSCLVWCGDVSSRARALANVCEDVLGQPTLPRLALSRVPMVAHGFCVSEKGLWDGSDEKTLS